MEAPKHKFLSGENTNYVIQEIIKGLTNYGIDINVKELQQGVFSFMNELNNKHPNGAIPRLNAYVIKTTSDRYMQNRPANNQSTRKSASEGTNSLYERELQARRYAQQQQQGGQQQQSQQQGISLNQALGTEQIIEGEQQPQGPPPSISTRINSNQEDVEQPMPLSPSNVRPQYPTSENQQNTTTSNQQNIASSPHHNIPQDYNEILLSLTKNDLINVDGDMFTFCWNHKVISDFRDDFNIELKYVVLPKNWSHLLVKYGDSENNGTENMKSIKSKVYNATGKNYNAKLIPCHTSNEHTTYQAIHAGQNQSGSSSVGLRTLPSTLTFHMSAPGLTTSSSSTQNLDLNVVPVQSIVKADKTIQITTKAPHNLSEDDQLSLEFLQQHICYRITNLKILSDRQISFDSPFKEYFRSDFRLIRNNWNIDLTLVCRYRTK